MLSICVKKHVPINEVEHEYYLNNHFKTVRKYTLVKDNINGT